jgi:hypothetical protein
MTRNENISIPVPDLSPEAACALADRIETLAHEVDLYYGDQIRSYLQTLDRKQLDIEQEIDCLRNESVEQQEKFLLVSLKVKTTAFRRSDLSMIL